MSETLDLDAIAEWFEGKMEHSSLDDLSVVSEWHTIRDMLDEIRHLRADVARVESWIETWERESVERGPNDTIYSAGAAALLRLAIRKPARPMRPAGPSATTNVTQRLTEPHPQAAPPPRDVYVYTRRHP